MLTTPTESEIPTLPNPVESPGRRSHAISEEQVHTFTESLLGEDLHAKRVLSLALATLGVIHAASLSVHAIGQALAVARGKQGKHGVKQVVALYSRRFTIEESFRDTKDLRFGMGLSSMSIAEPERRDRLLLLSALACTQGIKEAIEAAGLSGARFVEV